MILDIKNMSTIDRQRVLKIIEDNKIPGTWGNARKYKYPPVIGEYEDWSWDYTSDNKYISRGYKIKGESYVSINEFFKELYFGTCTCNIDTVEFGIYLTFQTCFNFLWN